MVKVAVIGGTGVYDASWLSQLEVFWARTPYGDVELTQGVLAEGGEPVIFLNRHGQGHRVPPHQVNYRANIWALKDAGVHRIIATAAVGSMNFSLPTGSLVLVDDFIDFTKNRLGTFYDGGDMGVVHRDMSSPYCRESRQRLWEAAQPLQVPLTMGGVYVCTEGPRFETPAEIRAFRALGGDLVGMTGVPEVALARELDMCYVSIGLVTNYAAGMSEAPLSHHEVVEVMAQQVQHLRSVLAAGVEKLQSDFACQCTVHEPPLTG